MNESHSVQFRGLPIQQFTLFDVQQYNHYRSEQCGGEYIWIQAIIRDTTFVIHFVSLVEQEMNTLVWSE
jgi:hypothetical protein